MRGISWLAAKPVSFWRRTLLHGVSKWCLPLKEHFYSLKWHGLVGHDRHIIQNCGSALTEQLISQKMTFLKMLKPVSYIPNRKWLILWTFPLHLPLCSIFVVPCGDEYFHCIYKFGRQIGLHVVFGPIVHTVHYLSVHHFHPDLQ
jgi:hypothetical protein